MPPVECDGSRLLLGCGSGVGGLLCLFGGALLRLLAGLCLVRIAAGFALCKACLIEEAQNAIGRLGAAIEPVLDAVDVQFNALGIILGKHRIPGTELLEEPAVTR